MTKEEKNISCNLFFEQLQLINQLPMEERGSVLYLAILNAFLNQDDIQVENQLENTYISISKSISLSILSNTVLDLLKKTIVCKKYNKNWGGKREGSGKPKTDKIICINKPTIKQLEDYQNQIGKRFDIEAFIEHYDACNWCDKNGLPINWKQKASYWARNNRETKLGCGDGLF